MFGVNAPIAIAMIAAGRTLNTAVLPDLMLRMMSLLKEWHCSQTRRIGKRRTVEVWVGVPQLRLKKVGHFGTFWDVGLWGKSRSILKNP
jgi:hypothetical protein